MTCFIKQVFFLKQMEKKLALNIVNKINQNIKIENVLISVSNKEGIENFINSLLEINSKLNFYSTGGTYKLLEKIIDPENLFAVSEYTGQPEMQGGLVKTLDFKIYM